MSSMIRYRFKVIILGDTGVGKTSLMNHLEICDTGQENFQSLFAYHDFDCCVMVYDVNALKSFEALSEWRERFLRKAAGDPKNFPFVVIGTKIDINDGNSKEVSAESVQNWCTSNGYIPYFELSAKEGTQVDKAFHFIAKSAIKTEYTKTFDRETLGLEPVSHQSSIIKVRRQVGPYCYAYGTVYAIEVVGEGQELSIQQLIDGSKERCLKDTFDHVKEFGVTTATNYPFTGRKGDLCRHKIKEPIVWIRDFGYCKDYLSLMRRVVEQPVIMNIIATREFMRCPENEIFRGPLRVEGHAPDHTVVVVGFDFKPTFHWVVLSSWGTDWANGGYAFVSGEVWLDWRGFYPIRVKKTRKRKALMH